MTEYTRKALCVKTISFNGHPIFEEGKKYLFCYDDTVPSSIWPVKMLRDNTRLYHISLNSWTSNFIEIEKFLDDEDFEI